MFFKPRCPVGAAEREWIETSLAWLSKTFALADFRGVKVVLPTPEFFPDVWDGQAQGLGKLVGRVAGYMGIERDRLHVTIFEDREHLEVLKHIAHGSVETGGAAGLYHRGTGDISIAASKLGDPMGLVATVAHELGHVLLLGDGRIPPDRPDHEPLTDLLTVALGMGVFTANSAFRFNASDWGWSWSRLGYLNQDMWAYALACFAAARREDRPAWLGHVDRLVASGVRDGLKFLKLEPFRPSASQ